MGAGNLRVPVTLLPPLEEKDDFLPEVTSFCWASLQRFPVPMEALPGKSTRLEMKHNYESQAWRYMPVIHMGAGGRGIGNSRSRSTSVFQNEIMSKRKRSSLGWGGTVGEARRGSGLVSSTAKYVNKHITEREEKVKVFHKSPAPPRPSVASVVSLASA